MRARLSSPVRVDALFILYPESCFWTICAIHITIAANQLGPPTRQGADAAYRYVAVAGAARHGVNNKTKQ
jgi:hypothetical protein